MLWRMEHAVVYLPLGARKAKTHRVAQSTARHSRDRSFTGSFEHPFGEASASVDRTIDQMNRTQDLPIWRKLGDKT
jgi:hypothetical protein